LSKARTDCFSLRALRPPLRALREKKKFHAKAQRGNKSTKALSIVAKAQRKQIDELQQTLGS
jgi:hypothetical protein